MIEDRLDDIDDDADLLTNIDEMMSRLGDITEDKKFQLLSNMHNSLCELARTFYPHYCKLNFSPMHHKLSDILINAYKQNQNGVIILPRGFAKSTFLLLFFLTWILMFTSEKYIIMIGESFDAIIKHLGEKIAREITCNPDLRLFGLRKGAKWTISKSKGYIEVLAPDIKNGGTRRVIIECKSAGSSLRGSAIGETRPGVLFIDDLERQKNGTIPGVESPAYRQEIMKWFFGQVVPLGGECGSLKIFMLGTIMHTEQLLMKLYEKPMEGSLKFFGLKYGYRYKDRDGVEKSLWNEKYTLEQLKALEDGYEKMGMSDMFANEFLSITHDKKNAAFNTETYRYYQRKGNKLVVYGKGLRENFSDEDIYYDEKKDREVNLKDCIIFTAVDPAISEKEKACYSSIATIAVEENHNWYILDISYGRWNVDELQENIFNVAKTYKPIFVGIENVGFQGVLKPQLEKIMLYKNSFFTIKDIASDRATDKGLRIRSYLQWKYNSNTIYHPIDKNWVEEYEEELGGISNQGTKGLVDLPDSVALAASLTYGEGANAMEEIKKRLSSLRNSIEMKTFSNKERSNII